MLSDGLSSHLSVLLILLLACLSVYLCAYLFAYLSGCLCVSICLSFCLFAWEVLQVDGKHLFFRVELLLKTATEEDADAAAVQELALLRLQFR